MKYIFILLLLPFMATAQKTYTISGTLSELKTPAKAYLVTIQSGAWKETDSTEIKNGKFQFTGSLAEPQQVIIAVKRTGSTQRANSRDTQGFFLENSHITLTASDSIQNAVISGSLANKESKDLEALTRPLTDKIIRLNNEFGKKNAEGAFLKSLDERKKAGDSVQKLVAEIKNVKIKFVETHFNSFMGLYTFNVHILDSKFDPIVVEPMFNRFSAALKSSPLGLQTVEKIAVGKRRQAGAKATDFTQIDLSGKPFTLSSLRGKYVLVDFWASWCIPCRAENPNVVKAYQQLKDKNFEIVGVSLDYPGSHAAWAGAVKKDGLPWIQVSDLKGWKNEVALMYGINSVPQNLLINPQGMIIAKNLRGENLLEQLKAYIK
ncbi:MAG: redoxin domain-containing protein [Bacteroidia bacterium]